mgnify:CR=1 FL=1
MNTVKVRDIEIGAGAPKIIVPIVGVTTVSYTHLTLPTILLV